MGELPRSAGYGTRCYSVHTPNTHDVETAGDGKFVGTHDVHTNAGELCVCCESGCEIGTGRVERVGLVHIHGVSAGLLIGYEFVVHVAR